MKKVVFFLILLFAGQTMLAQPKQQDISKWYPVVLDTIGLNGFKVVNTWNGNCISGNCKNGDGVFGSINTFWPTTYDVPIVKIVFFRGSFSNEGNNFKGKMYQINVEYDKTSPNVNKAYPLKSKTGSIDLTDEEQIKPYLLYEGEAIAKLNPYNKKFEDYLPHGNGIDPILLKEDNMQSMQGYYKDGYLYWTEIIYNAASTLKSYTGYVTFTGELLAGRLLYKNGQTYEGFFVNSKPHGPGVMTTIAGVKSTGKWLVGKLAEKRAISFPETMFQIPVADENKSTQYTVGNKQHRGILLGETKEGYKFIQANDKLFFGSLNEEGKANGYGYFYELTFPKRIIGLSPTRGDILIWEGTFLNSMPQVATQTRQTFVNKDLKPYYSMLHAQQFALEDSYTINGNFANQQLDGCMTHYSHYSNDITITQYKNGMIMKGWSAQLSQDSKVISAVYYCTLNESSTTTTSLVNKQGITEADINAAMVNNTGCIPVPQEIKKKYLDYASTIMEQQRVFAKTKAKSDSLAKSNKAITPTDWQEQECNTIKKYLPRHQRLSYVSPYGESAILLDYDCTQKKYVMAVRKKAITHGNSYAPHHYLDIQLIDPPTLNRLFNTIGYSLQKCPACHGYPAGEQQYVNKTWTKKYVLGLKWYVQEDKIERGKMVVICQKCKGEALVR